MGNVHFSIPPQLSLKLRDAFGLSHLIETGTYKGGTASWAADKFQRVTTIEGWREYYDKTSQAHKDKKNVRFLFGDSRIRLPEVLAQESNPCLIWLDAHYLGDSVKSGGTDGECPLRDELTAIGKRGVRHFILIDDVHCFEGRLNAGSVRELWPTIKEIKERILNYFPDYLVTTFEDVVIAVPPEARPVIEEHIKYAELKVVVATSNKYVHCITPFGRLLNHYTGDRTPVHVVRYEVKAPKVAPNFRQVAIGNQADYTWSGGIMAYLRLPIAPSMFVFMLEDYWLTEWNKQVIETLWRYMCNHPEVGKIDLSGDRLKTPYVPHDTVKGIEIIRSADDAAYQTSIQAAIWRNDFMLSCLSETENAWQFEKAGTRRMIARRKKDPSTPLVLGTKNIIPAHYVNAVGGEGRKPGEYDPKRVTPDVIAKLKELGVTL